MEQVKMKPLFIIGSPRSGTTFLSSLLKPSSYGAPFETQFFIKYNQKLPMYGDLNIFQNLEKLIEDISKERPVQQWEIALNTQEIYQQLNKENITFNAVLNQICLKVSAKKGKISWGDKTPQYIDKIETINHLFPEAKYLYIIRDGRDVARSLLKKPWGPNNFYTCAVKWKNSNKENSTLKILEKNGQLLKIKYEDLLDDTINISEKIYLFLNEAYPVKEITPLLIKTRKGNYYKWREKMSAGQLAIYNSCAGETLKLHGYDAPQQQKHLNLFTKLFFLMHDKILYLKHMFIMNVIDGIKIKYLGKQPFSE